MPQMQCSSPGAGCLRLGVAPLLAVLAAQLLTSAQALTVAQVPPAPMPARAPAPGPAPAPAPGPQAFIGPDYKEHGTNWLAGTCASRLRQSPVNLDRLTKSPPQYFADFNYNVINDPLILKAQSGFLSVDLSEKLYGGVVYNDEWYPIIKIDIHGPAEHLFKGYQNPVEIQLVHRKMSDPQQTLILSVLVWCEAQPPPPNISAPSLWVQPGANELDFNPNIQKLVSVQVPHQQGTQVTIPPQGIDLNIFVNNPAVEGSGEYINYRGSLTTPPCLDATTWFIRRKTVIASSNQVLAFQNALYRLTEGAGSYRSIMPINGRFFKVFEFQKRMELVTKPYQRMPWAANPRTDGEMQAYKLARIANNKAEHAAYYAEGFARRSANADEAFAKVMQGPVLDREGSLADHEAKKKAARELDYQRALRIIRQSVVDSSRVVQTSIDQTFRATAQQAIWQHFQNPAFHAKIDTSMRTP